MRHRLMPYALDSDSIVETKYSYNCNHNDNQIHNRYHNYNCNLPIETVVTWLTANPNINMAMQQVTVQSSTYSDACFSHRAVDGFRNTSTDAFGPFACACAKTEVEFSPWWMIDMG